LLLSIALSFLLLARGWRRCVWPVLLVVVVVGPILLSPWVRIPAVTVRLQRWLRPVLRVGSSWEPDTVLFDEVARRARDLSPQDAVFLTPPWAGRFRLVAERAVVAEFKLVAFHDTGINEWRKRMFDCYGTPHQRGFYGLGEMTENYRRITDAKLSQVAEAYGASYAVLYADTQSDLPILYANSRYKVVSLSRAGATSG